MPRTLLPPFGASSECQSWESGGHRGVDPQAAGEAACLHVLPVLPGAAAGTVRRGPGLPLGLQVRVLVAWG